MPAALSPTITDVPLSRRSLLILPAVGLAGCNWIFDRVYYAGMEKFGREKRDILAKRVAAGRANAAIKDLMRILIPINYTRAPRFRHDPATPVPALPTIATATELDQFDEVKLGFARTQLIRGQNRLVAALREAKRIADAATA